MVHVEISTALGKVKRDFPDLRAAFVFIQAFQRNPMRWIGENFGPLALEFLK
jgi:hypothetical protein